MADGIDHIFGGMGRRPDEYSRGGDRTEENKTRDRQLTQSGGDGVATLEKFLQTNQIDGKVKLMRGSDHQGGPLAYLEVEVPSSAMDQVESAFPDFKVNGMDLSIVPPRSEIPSYSGGLPAHPKAPAEPERRGNFARLRNWWSSTFE